jgi:hypothetical protein
MTNKTRHTALQPIGRGPLHGSPTMESARQAALRAWARERRREGQKAAPADTARLLAKREDDAPRR